MLFTFLSTIEAKHLNMKVVFEKGLDEKCALKKLEFSKDFDKAACKEEYS